jgi:hypothetical protein
MDSWRRQQEWLHGVRPDQQAAVRSRGRCAGAACLGATRRPALGQQRAGSCCPGPAAHANITPALQPQPQANNAAAVQPQANEASESGWTREYC